MYKCYYLYVWFSITYGVNFTYNCAIIPVIFAVVRK